MWNKDKVFIIGEAGVNHNGSFDLAIELIDIAVSAGLDAVKFQTWKTESLLTKNVEKAAYQKATTGENESQFDMIKKLELPFQDFKKLKKYAESKGIMFLSSAIDKESVDFLYNIGMDIFKFSSSDLTNLPYLQHVAKFGKNIILSTGMANIIEVKEAVQVLVSEGLPLDKITVLHCNTDYPTAMKEVNLFAMDHIKKETNVHLVGYSDHTMGIEVPIAAVAIGAKVIEKHFTINRNMVGPDHKASLEPLELKCMVQSIRNVENAISGTKLKFPGNSETLNIPIARKSIVASKEILSGEILSKNNLTVKRPGIGISPMKWDKVIGTIASRNFSKDELIQL